MVIEIQTEWSPLELLDFCLKVELELGRKREIVWGPRTIDLDILLYNQKYKIRETYYTASTVARAEFCHDSFVGD
jgi:2-amino-4-hydroxy-6-hydroxymethyldihydropteridine diphosphokinase